MYKIINRPIDESIYNYCSKNCFTDLQSRILAGRNVDKNFIKNIDIYKYEDLQSRNDMKNIDEASKIILDHIKDKKKILLVTDYDTDGITSASVMYSFFKDIIKYPRDKFRIIINKRDWGNGVNIDLVNHILEDYKDYDLIITADHGTVDDERYKILKENNFKIVVTDHHTIPKSGIPKIPDSFVNPQQPGCNYDKSISGCTVIYFVLERVLEKIDRKNLKKMYNLLDFVAVSIIADNMSLMSINNRILVKRGFHVLNRENKRTIWKVLQYLDNTKTLIDEKYIGFNIAPRINSTSRMGDADLGFMLMITKDIKKCFVLAEKVNELNNLRKELQKRIYLTCNSKLSLKLSKKKQYSILEYVENGNGLQGIIASMLGNNYNLPAIVLTDKKDNLLAGSGRGNVENFNLKAVIDKIHKKDNNIILRYGGHEAALGLEIHKDKFNDFKELFEYYCKEELENEDLQKELKVDLELDAKDIDLDILRDLEMLLPFGKEFDNPVFKTKFIITRINPIKNSTHSIVYFKDRNGLINLKGLYINSDKTLSLINSIGKEVEVFYNLNINSFMNRTDLQLLIEYIKV